MYINKYYLYYASEILIIFILLQSYVNFLNINRCYKISKRIDKYKNCFKCSYDTKIKQYYCNKCPIDIIFEGLKIVSKEETINEIITKNKSISRFGDGEFNLIFGEDIQFQNSNVLLIEKLIKVLNSNEKDLMIGINIPCKIKELNKYNDFAKKYKLDWIEKNKIKILKILNKTKIYYSSDISRFYIDYKIKSNIKNYIQKFKMIWNKKNVIIIEGEMTRLGIGNDLFDNLKSIKRIICPPENAFIIYNKIIKEVIKYSKYHLILIALGPTATVLAYDLYKLGYQVIDVGHIDIEYEWYLKNATMKLQIENKYVNEVKGKNYNFSKVKDKKYYTQIIAKILK